MNIQNALSNLRSKPKVVTTVIGVALMAGISMFVAYASLNRRNVSLYPDTYTGAANPSCFLSLTLKSPTPAPSATPVACSVKPVDIVLSLDRSGSMGRFSVNNKLKLEWEKNAAKAFVAYISSQPTSVKSNVRIGVVHWAGNNNLVKTLSLTNNFSSVTNFISTITYNTNDDYTCIECGLNKASSLFGSTTSRKVIVLMSDGIGNRVQTNCTGTTDSTCSFPTPPACTFDSYLETHCEKGDIVAINASNVIKDKDVLIKVIGYGSKISPLTMLENNLMSISSPNEYIYGGSETNWDNVFKNIAPTICSDIPSVATPTPVTTVKATPVATKAPCSTYSKLMGKCK